MGLLCTWREWRAHQEDIEPQQQLGTGWRAGAVELVAGTSAGMALSGPSSLLHLHYCLGAASTPQSGGCAAEGSSSFVTGSLSFWNEAKPEALGH